MATNGRYVYALRQKITVLAETLCEAGEITSSSIAALARYCNINVSTLKSACANQQISTNLAKKLSEGCRFELSDQTWIDMEYDDSQRRKDSYGKESQDTHEKFRGTMRNAWSLNNSYVMRIRSSPPICHENALATFSVDDGGQSTAPDSSIQLFLTVDAEKRIEEAGFSYGFNSLKIAIDLPEMETVESVTRFDLTNEFSSQNVSLSVRGTNFQPYWILSSENKVLDGSYVTTSSPLCSFPSQCAGTKFSASLSAQIRDGSLERTDDEDMPPPAKRAIIESLLANAIDDNASKSGWLTFGRQNLEIVRLV